jgi:hypothetical protein
MMLNNLQFRRQFFLSRVQTTLPNGWNFFQIGRYCLYSHPDLDVTQLSDQRKRLVLIGDIFSPAEAEKRNAEILKDIFVNVRGMKALFLQIKPYAGRFALVYMDDKEAIILHDALSLREIYYCPKENEIVCGSQPNLIIKFAKPGIMARCERDFLDYFKKNSINGRWNPHRKWIGDETYYEGINHLLPNHFLDLNTCGVQRYWPNETIRRLDLGEAVSESCSFLQGSIRAMTSRYSIMAAVTAGWDSRTLLAATKDVRDRIYFFVNNQGLGPGHPDIMVPRNIFAGIGVPFHVHDVPMDVDNEFRRIFLNNTFFSSERILPTIYNVYFKDHSNNVNMLGIGEIGRTRFGKEPKYLSTYRIIHKMKQLECRYAIRQGEKILHELLPVSRAYNLNVLTLLYWEHWLGNWGVTGNSESDIAVDEINPYDSHKLYEIFLGVDNKYTRYDNPVIFKEMIRKMWPELMQWPINPPHNSRDKAVKLLKKIRIYSLLKEARYIISSFKYRFITPS